MLIFYLVYEILEKRAENPWLSVSDSELFPFYVRQAINSIKAARRRYGPLTHKALEYILFNSLIPKRMRMEYTVFLPRAKKAIKVKLREILEKGKDATIRTCHKPFLPGGGPYRKINSFEVIEELFSNPDDYQRLVEPVVGKDRRRHRVKQVLVGAIPKGKLDKDKKDQHCAWTLSCSASGEVKLQVLPFSPYLRQLEEAPPEDIITTKIELRNFRQRWNPLIKVEIGSNLKADEQRFRAAMRFNELVLIRVLLELRDGDLAARLAAINRVMPLDQYASVVLEGQARIDFEKLSKDKSWSPQELQEYLWCYAYGIKVDPINRRSA